MLSASVIELLLIPNSPWSTLGKVLLIIIVSGGIWTLDGGGVRHPLESLIGLSENENDTTNTNINTGVIENDLLQK